MICIFRILNLFTGCLRFVQWFYNISFRHFDSILMFSLQFKKVLSLRKRLVDCFSHGDQDKSKLQCRQRTNEREGKIKFLPNQLKKMNQLNCKCKCCCCWGKLHEKHEDKNRFFLFADKKNRLPAFIMLSLFYPMLAFNFTKWNIILKKVSKHCHSNLF